MNNLKLNIAVIAGYGRDIDKLPMHSEFVEQSVFFGLENDVDLFFVVGGATNPDYPGETEAEASFRVIETKIGKSHQIFKLTNDNSPKEVEWVKEAKDKREEIFHQVIDSVGIEGLIKQKIRPFIVPVVVLGTGNTSADTLREVKNFLEKRNIEVDKLIYCSEIARSHGFGMDGLFVDLTKKAGSRFIQFSCPFPETKEEFENQKKKLLLKLLSHRYPFFRWLRHLYQKRHQKRVAKIKRRE